MPQAFHQSSPSLLRIGRVQLLLVFWTDKNVDESKKRCS